MTVLCEIAENPVGLRCPMCFFYILPFLDVSLVLKVYKLVLFGG